MATKSILPQPDSARNGAPFRVELTRPARTLLTGLTLPSGPQCWVLPAGMPGHILEPTKEYVLIDFSLALEVIRLPLDSTLIRFVGGQNGTAIR